MTYLVRLPQYKKGDFISCSNSFYYISSISGDKVHVCDLSSWKEKVFDGKELQKASLLGGKELIKEMILVSQSQDEVQAMYPKTYKTIDIRKPKKVSFNSKMISTVELDDKFFLFPNNKIDN